MCGIFGIVSREGPVSRDVLAQAVKSLAHRGPDDSGVVVIEGDADSSFRIGLAHTRLSILDLSPLGHQPMRDPITGNWIVFNGEIYNFRELRKELQTLGVEFNTNCDTEVILAAYRSWGEDCLLRLKGMFAFAIWDAQRKHLLMARDPMGIKPLYYYHSKREFIFASEIRTLLGTGLVPRKVDPAGMLSYLEFGSICEPWTIVDRVTAVPAGSVLTIENGSVRSREYWSSLRIAPSTEVLPKSSYTNTTEKQLPAILRDAVLSHLVSDVPVGVFLSGGIDSSALVAILSQNNVRANTFSLVFEEAEFDEAKYSREIARLFGTEHQEIAVSQRDTIAVLPEALVAMDQPTIDGVNTYLVSAKAREAGVKVALTGLGADEMFAGYSNFRRVPAMESFSLKFGRLPKTAQRPLAAMLAIFAGLNDRNRKFAEMTATGGSNVHPYFLARMLFGHDDRAALISASDREASQQRLDQLLRSSVEACQSLDPVNRVSHLESHFYMRNTLLRDSDGMSMAHGLELRVPFLDRDLVEACFRISGDRKLKKGVPKHLLLDSLGIGLPREIVNRPKRGFTLPFERWLRGEMRSTVEEVLLRNDWDRLSIRADSVKRVWNRFLAGETSWSRPWSLFVLKRWCDQNL